MGQAGSCKYLYLYPLEFYYDKVNFIQNTHKRYPLAYTLGSVSN